MLAGKDPGNQLLEKSGMLKAKKKLTKKELKQDKFVLFTLDAKAWAEEHVNQIVGGLIAFLVIVGGSYMWVSNNAAAEREALSMLSDAQSFIRNSQVDAGIDLMNQVTSEYNGTNAAGKALFLLGRHFWERNENESAAAYFRRYLDEHGEENVMTQAVHAGFADCLFAQGNFAEAAGHYEKAAEIEPDFPQAGSYLYSAASSYHEAGNDGKAKALAERVVEKFEQNFTLKSRAQFLLESLKVKG